MPSYGQPLGADDIRSRLQEVAGELAAHGPRHTLVIVGGSLMAWNGLRESTADVDTGNRVDAELVAAVAAVGMVHGLSPTWLNDRAAGFMPATFDIRECETLLDLPRLRVLGAPLAQLFVMKLYAGRDRDIDDLVALWPVSGFRTPEEAAEMFRCAYPHAPDDPYLASWVKQIADMAG